MTLEILIAFGSIATPILIVYLGFYFKKELARHDERRKSTFEIGVVLDSFSDLVGVVSEMIQIYDIIKQEKVIEDFRSLLKLWVVIFSKATNFEMKVKRTFNLSEEDIETIDKFIESVNFFRGFASFSGIAERTDFKLEETDKAKLKEDLAEYIMKFISNLTVLMRIEEDIRKILSESSLK